MKCFLFSILFIFYISIEVECTGLSEEFTWTRISYVLPNNDEAKRSKRLTDDFIFPGSASNPVEGGNVDQQIQDTYGGEYIYQNNIPMGANRWKDKLFITVPRRKYGIPSSLNYVSLNNTDRHNVPLIPYPNYEMNKFGYPQSDETLLTSVYRVAVDPCDRLWFVDTGIIDLPKNRTEIQPMSLVIMDLNTDKIIRRHVFPDSNLLPASNLVHLTIDVTSDTCDDAYAYIPDFKGYGLVVYSFEQDSSWRVTHNYFFLESISGEFFIGGYRYQWNDGVFSVALSEIQQDGYRNAYFHSLAGTHMFSVSTRILKNKTLATRSYHENDFKILGNRYANSQTSATDLHKNSGIMFLALVNQNALGCWNTRKQFRPANFAIVHKNNEKFIYAADVKIYKDDIIVLTNNIPISIFGMLNFDSINFRVWMGNVRDTVRGTVCDFGRHRPKH